MVDYEKDGRPQLFLGSLAQDKRGSGPGEFNCATSVAVDSKGRLYVCDYINDRVQIFSPEGELLKTIAVYRPAVVAIHQRTEEIYVFSWIVITSELDKIAAARAERHQETEDIQPTLTKFHSFEDPRKVAEYELPLPKRRALVGYCGDLLGLKNWGAVDGYGERTTIWLSPARGDRGGGYGDAFPAGAEATWRDLGIRILTEEDGQLRPLRHFGEDAARAVQRVKPPWHFNQQLYVNPTDGRLYVWEGDRGHTLSAAECCQQLVEIDAETGRQRLVDLPFSAQDMAFDLDGHLYVRSTAAVMRFDPTSMREVPWDYGEQRRSVGEGNKGTSAIGALVLPAQPTVCYRQAGMGVSPDGRIAVACHVRSAARYAEEDRRQAAAGPLAKVAPAGKPYVPTMYPGRHASPTSCCVHIWDRHGRLQTDDAVPGLPQLDGVQIDRDGNVYVMACPGRVFEGKRHFNDKPGTLIKFRPRAGRIVSTAAPMAAEKDDRPEGDPQVQGSQSGSMWIQNAEWFFGGAGSALFNEELTCACWWARWALDFYARSFVPEVDLFRVGVLDSNGNLMTHIGQYGNVDDGRPLIAAGGPPSPNAIGGDEVGLAHAKFVATHTDRRVFIADAGNHCIRSVKLGYHAEARIALKDVTDRASGQR